MGCRRRGDGGPQLGLATPRHILPVIVGAQFAGTSLWFAGNAVLPQLSAKLGVDGAISDMTSSVQLGFIVGTALLTLSGLGDRWPSRAVFFVSTTIGALFNLGALWAESLGEMSVLRFGVGFALAGVYPVGMKAAASWYRHGLGNALGLLVGALVLGTALPHLASAALPWRTTLTIVSGFAFLGGVAVFVAVPEGPHTRRAPFRARVIPELLRNGRFRRAALGYFGHMWELYTFWAFLPLLLALHGELSISLTTFATIAAGAVGCAAGGVVASRLGSRRVARVQLGASGACCLLLPIALALPGWAFAVYLFFWGVVVAGDSPQLSALTAQAAPPDMVGTGLSLTTSLGFALTVLSIEVADALGDVRVALTALAIGPAVGVFALRSGNDSAASPER